MSSHEPLLTVEDLRVRFPTLAGPLTAVDGVSFSVARREVFSIVGESGSGKSATALAILGLTPRGAQVSGSVRFDGVELLGQRESALRRIRGRRVGVVFQDPMTSLNPVFTIGEQIAEVVRIHHLGNRRQARERAVEALARVGIPSPRTRADDYPHQFSGGMRQRAMIAMALVCEPDLIMADEPTTALDVTIQAQILELLLGIRDERGTSLVLITHDLGVVANVSDRVTVMYAGQVHEAGSTEAVFYRRQGPYTWGLLASTTRLDDETREPLRSIRGVPPSLLAAPAGCRFAPRCPSVLPPCERSAPPLQIVDQRHEVRCLRVDEAGWAQTVAAPYTEAGLELGA